MEKRNARVKYTLSMEKQIDSAFRKANRVLDDQRRATKRKDAATVLANRFGTTVGAIKIKAHRLGW